MVVGLIGFVFVVRPVLKALLTPSPTPVAYPPVRGQMSLPSENYKPGAPGAEQMVQMARQNPQAATKVVKQWLKEK
ncbi:MAG: hypothetical protein MPW14_23895 [Candidatus Manganitrophus sp.]|nr:MAG: hypothetical protein MPW14_23895 [Candidatus Manganitrophus sp.]